MTRVRAPLNLMADGQKVDRGGGVGNDNDPDGHRQNEACNSVDFAAGLHGDLELFLEDAAGRRLGQFLQLPHPEARVGRAHDRRAVLRV